MKSSALIQQALTSIEKLLDFSVQGLGWARENGNIAILGTWGDYFDTQGVRQCVTQNLCHLESKLPTIQTFTASHWGLNDHHQLTVISCGTAQIESFHDEIIGLVLALPEDVTLSKNQQDAIFDLTQLTATAVYGTRALHEAHRRQVRLEAVATVGRDATVLLNPDDLLNRVAHLISHQFGFYHTGIFLVDDSGEYAVLHATNSEYGQKLIAQNHRLKIGEQGMVGYVTGTGQARIASNVSVDDTHYVNPMLPNTRSEITLPLYYGEQVIGALDVQSTKEDAFTEDDCTTLQIMADQLANALINARLHEEVWKRLDETRLLREVMVEASALNRQEVLRKALKLLQMALPLTYCAFFERRQDKFVVTPGSRWTKRAYAYAETPLKEVWTGKPIRLTAKSDNLDWVSPNVQALNAIPIRDGNHTSAIFAIASTQAEKLCPRDQNFLETLAAQLSSLLQHAQHHENTLRSRALLQDLITTGEAMLTAHEIPIILDQLSQAILAKIQGTVEVGLCTSSDILQWTHQTASPDLDSPLFLSPYLNPEHIPNCQSQLEKYDLARPQARDRLAQRHPSIAEAIAGHEVRYILLQPLQTVERSIGCLLIAFTELNPHHITQNITWTQALANQTALTLDNAQSFHRLRAQTQELGRAYEEAKHLNEVREQMIQNVNHELRTPLGIIMGYIDMLSQETIGPLNPQQREILQIVNSRTQHLNRLIQNLTSLQSRIQLKAIGPVALPDLVRQVVYEFQEFSQQQHIQFYIETSPLLPPIPGDMEHLHLALSHLIENAIKFSPNGGKVLIKLWEEEHWVVVTISDQGVGIPPEHINRIFERFYQIDGSTTRRFGGMGIGLALVWDIVEAHRGHIQVQSQPNEGSTFLIALPLTLEDQVGNPSSTETNLIQGTSSIPKK